MVEWHPTETEFGTAPSSLEGPAAAGSSRSSDPSGLSIDILMFDEVRMYDVATALEVFADRSDRGLVSHRVRLVGSGSTVTADSGAVFDTVEADDPPDLLIVPGSETRLGRIGTADLARIRDTHAAGGSVAGLCTGAFALAEAGLLEGRRATTHWRFVSTLTRRFPGIEVTGDELFVGVEGIWTSAGVSAGADLLLHLVEVEFGANAAGTIARSMVTPLRRAGNQAQYIDHDLADLGTVDVRGLEDRVRNRPHADWSVRRFAAELGISERTCYRIFRSLTGASPHAWLVRIRLDVARRSLETSANPIEMIAAETGLGTPDNLRKHFASRYGLSPRSYRARFAGADRQN